MLKIATHNSATGEKPANILSWLLIPFARTQSKTIKEQYDAGCRMFDLRVKMYNEKYHPAHGAYIAKRTFDDVLKEINSFNDSCYICVTYEGKFDSTDQIENFKTDMMCFREKYSHIYWGPIAVKYMNNDVKVDWITILPAQKFEKNIQGFIPLDGKHWQTYLPIPWLWNKIYTRKHVFNEEYFIFVDFL